ncbi:restriction endonuclease subunit S [Bradyrhizobium sp. SZCCHNRI1029]|uniref:restriction endonuclease subunit S n=1 Tax=Bradyrhizobium sp. SZCCHNRI1029 TaxID=3057278 RepID=UPI0029168C51|nr:restriction endonuclease subunit S [Bradyrhizobium sp. SZCCHNRI1029]
MSAAWPQVSLGELLRLERRPVDVIADHEYQEIGIFSYGRGIFHKRPRSGLEVGDKALFLMKEGDVILQITFAWEGAIALCSKAEDGLYGSVRYPTFRVDETQCFPPFLVRYLCTKEGLEQIGRICPGSAGRNRVLALKRLPEVMIPLPALEEQRRIVAKIEELVARLRLVQALRRETAHGVLAIPRSILSSDSSGHFVRLRDLVRLRAPDVVVQPDQQYQFAGVYSFGRGIFRSVNKMGNEFSYRKLTRVHQGNFVYPKLMAWEGALGVVPPDCDGMVVSTEFPVFEIDETAIAPEVLDIHFRSPEVWPSLSGQSGGTNVRRRRLNPQDFLNLQMKLPSKATQSHLVGVVRGLTKVSKLQVKTTAEVEALGRAILDRAFKGEL